MKPMHSAFALSAMVAFAGFASITTPAVAANSAMATCNKQWNDETAANTTNGATYQDFLKGCLKKNSAAAAPATTTTTTAAAPAATTTVAAADTMTADPAMAKMKKDCGTQWKAAKAADPTGATKKKDFMAACMAKMDKTPAATTTVKPATTTTTAPVVVKPATTTATAPAVVKPATTATAPAATTTMAPAASTTTAVAPAGSVVDAKGKVRTAGQQAEDKRIKQCGTEWKAAKAGGTTNGLKWPQFWSECNKRLKAASN